MGMNKLFGAIFGILIKDSRWKKASKCKKLIKQLRQRLLIKKSRRNAMMRQLRSDIAQLLHNGHHKAALSRALQLHKDQNTLSAYDQVEKFCDCLEDNLGQIHSQSSNLSGEVCEAVSSLIFAGSRCGELPELQSIRNLFEDLLGRKFVRANVELLPGNTVNPQIKYYYLSINSVAEDVKTKLVYDIAREYKHCFKQENEVQARNNLSKDVSNNGLKDQTRTVNFEEMLPEIGSAFALRDCKNMVNFWSNFRDGSDGISGSLNTIQKKNHEESCERIRPNGKTEAANLSFNDKGDFLRDREFVREQMLATLESCKDYKTSSVKRDVDEKLIKDREENARSSIIHVHPKLPDYEDLVVRFRNLKKVHAEKFNECST